MTTASKISSLRAKRTMKPTDRVARPSAHCECAAIGFVQPDALASVWILHLDAPVDGEGSRWLTRLDYGQFCSCDATIHSCTRPCPSLIFRLVIKKYHGVCWTRADPQVGEMVDKHNHSKLIDESHTRTYPPTQSKRNTGTPIPPSPAAEIRRESLKNGNRQNQPFFHRKNVDGS